MEMLKISPNDVSRFVYAWEDPEKKYAKFAEDIDSNKSYDKNMFFFKRNSNQLLCPSPILLKRDHSNRINDTNNTHQTNENNTNRNPNNTYKFNLFSKQSLDKSPSPYYGSQQRVPTEMDFSNLLAVMANEKQKLSNSINNNNPGT